MPGDLLRALGDLRDPRLWGVAVKAALLTLALLAGAFALGGWALGVGRDFSLTLPWIGEVALWGGATGLLWAVAALAFSALAAAPVAAVFVGVMLDSVVDAVEARAYPGLPPPRPVPALRQIGGALRLLGWMAVLNLLGLVVWVLAPPLAPFTFLAINGWLIGREYLEMVALRRLDPAGARRVSRRAGLGAAMIGAAVAAALAVPVLNLFAPLVGVAATTHLFHRVARDWRGARG